LFKLRHTRWQRVDELAPRWHPHNDKPARRVPSEISTGSYGLQTIAQYRKCASAHHDAEACETKAPDRAPAAAAAGRQRSPACHTPGACLAQRDFVLAHEVAALAGQVEAAVEDHRLRELAAEAAGCHCCVLLAALALLLAPQAVPGGCSM
jgi:hypothetical protein